MNNLIYDIIVIGGGPAGLTAGLYAARSGMKTLLIEKMGCGGHAAIADWIENYPGFPEGIGGFELASKMEEQARKFGLIIKIDDVVSIEKEENKITLKTSAFSYSALSVIIASGTRYRTLNVPGEKDFIGKGVSYCATCDGPFFRNKDVVVIGGGNSAIQEALFLTKFAKSVTIIHRRNELRAVNILKERALSNPKINIMWNTVVTSIEGSEQVEHVVIKNTNDGKIDKLETNGVFVFAGTVPNIDFIKDFIKVDEAGYISTDEKFETSVNGIFACGDVRKKILRQIITAAGEGASAAHNAQEYVDNIKS